MTTTRLAAGTAATQPVSVAKPAVTADEPTVPIQNRTPEQLKAGMFVKVNGAGADDLAVARLVQDGAAFIAKKAGSPVGLKTVDINDQSVDNAGALGMATFHGNEGWFGLSVRSTKGIFEGMKLLKTTPFDQWKEAQRDSFVQANEAILHEAGHVTLPGYDSKNISAWYSANRDFEEGLTEVTTMHSIKDFMKDEYGIDEPATTDRIQQSTSAYTRFTERLQRMMQQGTDGSFAAVGALSSKVADGVPADQREITMAKAIVDNLGGPGVPDTVAKDIASTLPGFVAEKNGTRTHLMEIQAALVDHKNGQTVDWAKLVASNPAAAPERVVVGQDPAKVGKRAIA